ncbi:porin [Bradyrhizobium sp. AUGA SZCCT0042]|uniref:porin n=1 Tax=Bradyrhizobium sp. AUGA SZCCT0042 TaxID=2807651 RepID=UPI001BA66A3D|nr:porin [Bradyrhizobium sp. AUGA SZCCT0042]MBR1297373.1 porin [Bradyrhizobium sp. AUGA SZCCT0042]
MKMIKSVVLGSAAGLIAMTGAQAADLPVKAKAVEYVRICSLYGAGFFYIPGTDTCIKLGGFLRVEAGLNTNSVYSGQFSGVGAAHNRLTNYYTARSREILEIDTRTATEYGVVRTFFQGGFNWTTGGYAGNSTNAAGTPAGTLYSASVGPAGGVINPTDGGTSGGSFGLYHALIQFAGFTMGKTISAFDAPWVNYPANNFDGLVGGGGTVTGVNQFTYTAQFGNGVSGALSAQDTVAYTQAGVLNLTGATAAGMLGGAYGVNNTAGTRAPDLIATLKVDQAWGLFQASLAAHNNTPGYYAGAETSGHPDSNWGFAVQGALQIKNIPTGVGDTLNVQAVYTDGATRYNIQNLAPNAFSMFGGTNVAGAYQSIAFANAPDAIYTGTSAANGTNLENVRTWGFRGGFNHNWDPYWSSGLYGAYAGVRYGNLGKTTICANVAALLTLVGTCNPDFNIAQAGIITRWTPVKNLTFSGDFTWTRLDQRYSGTVVNPALLAAVAKPAASYELRDQDSFNFLLRAQRNW